MRCKLRWLRKQMVYSHSSTDACTSPGCADDVCWRVACTFLLICKRRRLGGSAVISWINVSPTVHSYLQFSLSTMFCVIVWICKLELVLFVIVPLLFRHDVCVRNSVQDLWFSMMSDECALSRQCTDQRLAVIRHGTLGTFILRFFLGLLSNCIPRPARDYIDDVVITFRDPPYLLCLMMLACLALKFLFYNTVYYTMQRHVVQRCTTDLWPRIIYSTYTWRIAGPF